ncbi:hypothetical protein KDH_43650 [Dictyobacter sp. S3.2.2.5]|uniref:Uncharacterized protein n=1 Tax=Dictyobacter halimunensis TaxID=3026934 RepID=A0ABQ6FYF6_9CHLR|nr:hypothetical protein KDH_43650 [Dictyobacter sp. S3.2.2.5]
MAVLRAHALHIQVFASPSMLEVEPDVVEDTMAISVQFAVHSVMRRAGIDLAAVVYIRSDSHEMWLHDVQVLGNDIAYEYPVKRPYQPA